MCYYNRLLEGAVNALLQLEKNKADFFANKEIRLSSNIEDAFTKRFPHEPTGFLRKWLCNSRNRFYLVVFIALAVALFASIYNYCGKENSCASSRSAIQNVCKVKSRNDANETSQRLSAKVRKTCTENKQGEKRYEEETTWYAQSDK
jgi:hypothetical protein